jgi:hypothetical protein
LRSIGGRPIELAMVQHDVRSGDREAEFGHSSGILFCNLTVCCTTPSHAWGNSALSINWRRATAEGEKWDGNGGSPSLRTNTSWSKAGKAGTVASPRRPCCHGRLWSPGPLGDRTLPSGDIDLNPEIWESSSWLCSSRLRQAYVAAKVAGAEPACRKAIGRAEA